MLLLVFRRCRKEKKIKRDFEIRVLNHICQIQNFNPVNYDEFIYSTGKRT